MKALYAIMMKFGWCSPQALGDLEVPQVLELFEAMRWEGEEMEKAKKGRGGRGAKGF